MARRRTAAKQKKDIPTIGSAGIPVRQLDVKDMKQSTRAAMTELEKIWANLDRMAVWVKKWGIP